MLLPNTAGSLLSCAPGAELLKFAVLLYSKPAQEQLQTCLVCRSASKPSVSAARQPRAQITPRQMSKVRGMLRVSPVLL